MTAFAPLGFNEVRAVVSLRETFLELTDEDRAALALGISRVLSWYELSGYNSFNLALYSGPLSGAPGFRAKSHNGDAQRAHSELSQRCDAHGTIALGSSG